MSHRRAPTRPWAASRLLGCLAASVLVSACAPLGLGVAASNHGAAIGVRLSPPELERRAPRLLSEVPPPPWLLAPEPRRPQSPMHPLPATQPLEKPHPPAAID